MAREWTVRPPAKIHSRSDRFRRSGSSRDFSRELRGSIDRSRQRETSRLARSLAPFLIFLKDFLPRATFAIDHSRAVTVLTSHFVVRDDELPVPGHLGG